MKKLLKPLCRTLTASSIALALHPSAFAAIVRSDVDYQIFRDFAENKGKFHAGATNVEIRDKNGNALGTLLPNLPMIDFSPVDVQMRVATLVDPQYVVSVKHNSGYKNVRFGIKTGHSDIPDDTYRLVDRNNDGPPDIWWKYDRRHEDYHSPRLHRFVTEVVPMPTTTAGTDPNTYMDTARFPYMLRVGAGTQFRESANKDREELQGAYNYAIGGQSYDLQPKKQGFLDLYGNLFDKPLTNYAVPGDSGSPIFTFDKQQNKWVFLGTYTYWGGYTNTTWQEYIIYRNDFNQQRYAEDIAGQISADNNEEFIWEATDKTSTIRSTRNNNKTLVVDLIDASLKTAEEQLNYGKTAYLNGNNGLLKLQGDINQGAGGLYFNGNYTVSGQNTNTTWTGAGISVAEGKQVNWQIRNNDILSKIGSGTLHVNGTGKNDGKISVGDGTVILNQKADENGNKQAFKEVGIVSGRPTVILNDAEQVNPDRIYFGFRGGRLDLNGNNLTFKRIRNVDEGAMIVNHNANQESTLTLTGQNLFLPEQVTIREVHNSNRPAGYHLYHWQNGCENRYFVSKHDNMKASFPCKPGQGSTDDWEIVATDREEAINIVTQREIQRKDVTINAFDGYLGETNAALHNGKLNVNINAVNNQSTFLFTGGSQLNGDVTLNQGIAMFSGRPVPHANDYLNGNKGKDVVFDDEWINRTFNANNINVNNNSVFYSSRNVAQVNANFNASQNGQIHLGYKSGDPVCIRSDYTGKVTCSNEGISAKALNSFTATEIHGNTQLTDHAQLILGKAHLFGTINGTGNSLVRLTENANWTLTGDSQTAHLNLEKSHIFLNSQENPTVYNHLTINALNGEGTFHYASALTNQRGDKVTVTNQASGNFVLDVKDSGGEAKYEKLDLLDASKATRDPALKVSLARNHVDLGAYVYSLIEQDGIFRLYNAKLENEKIEAERIAKEKEEARLAEEARQRELARLEAERIAKEKEEQARLEAVRIAKEKEEARLAEEARQRNATTKPVTYKQKEIISANTNAVLSDTAMLTALNLELASRLDRTILTQRSGMWFSYNNSDHKYHSDDYKNFHSKSNQVALGAETLEMANGIVLGAMVTLAQTNNEFSSLSGKNTLSLATLYAKQQIDQFSWAIDTSYGWSRSKIDGEHKFDRNILNVGLNMAYDVIINGLQITPMLGVRYHQISSSEGELNGVIVKNPAIKLPTYHTGVKVGYHFNVNGWEITPEISTYYVSTGNKSYSQRINEQEFEQTFGHYTYHEASLSFGYKPWKVSMYAGNSRGKNKEKQNQFGVKLNYSW
jgi:S6 family igA-specific metalloendopeptidase